MTVPPNDRRPALQPPRFTLRSTWWFFTLVSILLAVMTAVGPLASLALVLLVLAVLAHVVGNALGVRLRANGDLPVRQDGEPTAPPASSATPAPLHFAPATQLSERRPFVLLLTVSAILGMAAGGSVGGFWLAHAYWEQSTFASIAVGVLASGVLGGLLLSLVSSFGYVAFQALRQALRDVQRE